MRNNYLIGLHYLFLKKTYITIMTIQKNVLYITTHYLTTQLEIFQKLKLITRFRGKLNVFYTQYQINNYLWKNNLRNTII